MRDLSSTGTDQILTRFFFVPASRFSDAYFAKEVPHSVSTDLILTEKIASRQELIQGVRRKIAAGLDSCIMHIGRKNECDILSAI